MNSKKNTRRSLIQKYFSLLERRKTSDRLLLQLALVALLVSAVYTGISLSQNKSISVPTSGGTLVEGVVGTPRFVNPVLATTRADQDMVKLIYSGLMKINQDGNLVPDLAEEVTLSDDGQTYYVKLRGDAYFHNGAKVTARDVAYTIALIQNPDLKSPLRGNWDGVLVEELGDNELNIVINKPYTPFIENLTVGIVPRTIWDELPTEQLPFSQNNTNPIGSGPYQIDDIVYNHSGLIDQYTLKAAESSLYNTNIKRLQIHFFADENELLKALNNGEIMSTAALSPNNLDKIDQSNLSVSEHTLPRIFAIYFNQNKTPILREKAVREALQTAIDKNELIDNVLHGHGKVSNSPIPEGFGLKTEGSAADYDHLTKAASLLSGAGWSKNEAGHWTKKIDNTDVELSISISTANTNLFDTTAEDIANTWRELGVVVDVAQFEQTDLVQAIIRPRNFQALLFGAEQGRALDLYPFWHSSQKSDPGLNIAQYTSIEADALLEKARKTTDPAVKARLTKEATDIIDADIPAIFLYTPTFSYVYNKDLLLHIPSRPNNQSDRFADIGSWYTKTEKVWPIFQRN